MNKSKFIYFNYKALLLIFIFICSVCFFMFPQEAFAMDPDPVLKSFNPDTYLRHELDGTPICESDRYESNKYRYRSYNNKETYHLESNDNNFPRIQELDSKPIYEIDSYPSYNIDPLANRYELHGGSIDPHTLQGKLRYDLHKSRCLGDKTRHQLYAEAKLKQSRCGQELPIYHKKVLDLPKTDKFSGDTSKCVFKRVNFLKWIDNKPTGILDPKYLKARAERQRRYYSFKHAQYKEWIRQENERMARYNARFGKGK